MDQFRSIIHSVGNLYTCPVVLFKRCMAIAVHPTSRQPMKQSHYDTQLAACLANQPIRCPAVTRVGGEVVKSNLTHPSHWLNHDLTLAVKILSHRV